MTLVLYLGAYMRLPLVPLFARGLGASTVDVGLINAGFMLAAAVLALPLGLMSDRLGRKRLILAGMGISCLTSLFLLAARTPLHVGLIYLFSGVGLACFSPAMMSHVGDSCPPNFLGRAYGWYTSALYLGMALGPGFGGAVATRGFETAFAVSAAIIGVGVVVGSFRVRRTAPPSPRPSGGGNLREDFREIVRNRAVLGCWIATFFSTYAWGSLFAFFPLYAKDLGVSIPQTGLIFTTQAAANALCRIPVGHLQDRTGNRRPFIVWGNALFGLCIALTGTARGPLPLYLLFAGVGASMAATFTAIGAVLSESVAMRVRGLAMGGYNTCIYGGFMVSAATLGFVIQRSGYAAGFAVAGLSCVVATAAVGGLLSGNDRS
ncbi:MAG TPA: MFS transporter [Deferrimonas sp.]